MTTSIAGNAGSYNNFSSRVLWVIFSWIFFCLLSGCALRHVSRVEPIRIDGSITPADYFRLYSFLFLNPDEFPSYFQDSAVNPYTIHLFYFLSRRFPVEDSENQPAQLERIRQVLVSNLPSDRANELFELFKKYLEYKKVIAEVTRKWGYPVGLSEKLEYLNRLQEFRRRFFGKETADMLFGAEVKGREYFLAKEIIISDPELYGAEKEARLQALGEQMWGNLAGQMYKNMDAYERYQEKLQIYSKDLAEADEEQKKMILKKLRQEFFSPSFIRKLEAKDEQMRIQQEKYHLYLKQKKLIMNDPDLTDEPESVILNSK